MDIALVVFGILAVTAPTLGLLAGYAIHGPRRMERKWIWPVCHLIFGPLTLWFAAASSGAMFLFFVWLVLGPVPGLLALVPGELREQARHLCPQCGYDLRATPNQDGPRLPRCPECGREVESSVP